MPCCANLTLLYRLQSLILIQGNLWRDAFDNFIPARYSYYADQLVYRSYWTWDIRAPSMTPLGGYFPAGINTVTVTLAATTPADSQVY